MSVAEQEKGHSWTFFGTYVAGCVALVSWLVYKFFRGRNQMRMAFVTIEQQLMRMQRQLEDRQLQEELDPLKNPPSEVEDNLEDTQTVKKKED